MILMSVPPLTPLQWFGLVHPVLIILFVYPVVGATIRLGFLARDRIDLRSHRGVHPRIGAMDVLPFVPLAGCSMRLAVEVAHPMR